MTSEARARFLYRWASSTIRWSQPVCSNVIPTSLLSSSFFARASSVLICDSSAFTVKRDPSLPARSSLAALSSATSRSTHSWARAGATPISLNVDWGTTTRSQSCPAERAIQVCRSVGLSPVGIDSTRAEGYHWDASRVTWSTR